MRFSGAVLAGGRSRRMGRDKASLPAPPYRSLVHRQLALLVAAGARESLLSLRFGQPLPDPGAMRGVAIVRDDGCAGPLGGLAAVLRAARTPCVLVLGVDLGGMQATVLRRLLAIAAAGGGAWGVVPRTRSGVQPLAAVWPRALLPLVEAQLDRGGDRSLRALVARAEAEGCLHTCIIPAWDEPMFANWNRPHEVVFRCAPV